MLRIGPVFGRQGNGLELTRRGIVADRHAQAGGFEVVAQHLIFLGRRAFVHAEQAGVFALGDVVGTADVGGQHGLFNQAVRLVAGAGDDFFDAPVFIANDLRLGRFKIHRTAHAARLDSSALYTSRKFSKSVHPRLALGGFRAARVGQNRRHFGVGEARVAEHHRRVKLVGVHLALGGDQHVADHAQALDIGVERAQAVGQLLGQHGNHAAREIHAGGAVVGVNVDGRAGFNIVAHVGNGHQQAPALATARLWRARNTPHRQNRGHLRRRW